MGFIDSLLAAVKSILSAFFSSTPTEPPAPVPEEQPPVSTGNYEPKIVRVSNTMELGRVGAAATTITLKNRKGVFYFATLSEVVASYYVGLRVDGVMMETNDRHNTLILYKVDLPSSGRELPCSWNPPYPNGYPVGTHQAEFLLYNGNHRLVQTLPFTLVVNQG